MNAGAHRIADATHVYDARLQHALRTAGVGAWHMDLINGNRVWSKEVTTLMGLPSDTALEHQIMVDAIHPEDRERVREIAQQALVDGASFETDCRVVWPDGSTHWVSLTASVHTNQAGQRDYIEGVVVSIEERKRLELALAESERILCSLISSLPGVVYRVRSDADWTVEFVSERILSMTGYSHEDFISHRKSFREIVHPEDRDCVRRSIETALEHDNRYEVQCRFVTAAGENIWVSKQGRGVRAPNGELRLLEGFLVDVTQTRQAEQERAQLEARLRQTQKMEALGTLAGGIAHDFNNVLTAIRGNASLALADLPPDSPALTSLIEIKRSSTRAADLVQQILAFSRQEKSSRTSISMQPVVAEALRLLRATLPASIEIRSDYAHELPNVLADPTQIHQIIMNLGVNSAQAIGDRPGRIDVRVDTVIVTDDGAIGSNGLRAGCYVRLRFSDDGVGMTPEIIERLYDPFFTTKPPGQGTGLGLSVVHGIVQAHEGAISVESEPGRGTTFCLCFPVAPEATIAQRSAPGGVPRGRGEHILYVDDEDALVFLAERALQRLGYKVTGHVDPARALEAFRAQPDEFDFVVTDLSMPGMSGRDLAHELMQIRPDIPIVLTSGYVRAEDAEAAQRLGIRDVVLKPNSIDDLARVVDAALAARRGGGPPAHRPTG